MAENSRIRFNPVTKEIEIEGSEKFVKTYFNKLQGMLSESGKEKVQKANKATKAAPAKKAKKEPKAKVEKVRAPKKAKKTSKKEPKKKRVTNIDTVVGLIQGSTEGLSTAELKEKTGLVESQIWNIVTRAVKEGKIRKVKRGVYVGA